MIRTPVVLLVVICPVNTNLDAFIHSGVMTCGARERCDYMGVKGYRALSHSESVFTLGPIVWFCAWSLWLVSVDISDAFVCTVAGVTHWKDIFFVVNVRDADDNHFTGFPTSASTAQRGGWYG